MSVLIYDTEQSDGEVLGNAEYPFIGPLVNTTH